MSKQLKSEFLEIYEVFKEFYCLHEFQHEGSKEIIQKDNLETEQPF